MSRRYAAALGAALALSAAITPPAGAQVYGPSPVPRSTDPATMRAAAVNREIRERFDRGIAAEMRGDWSAAIVQFDAVLARDPGEPQNSTAHYNLARALKESGRLDDAVAHLHEAIRRDPGFLAAYTNLAAVEAERGNRAAARAAVDRLLALSPQSARGLYARGILALESGDLATAASDLGRLLERNPRYAVAHYDLALVELKRGHLDAAERELTTALGLIAVYPRAQFALGLVLLREGKRDDARGAFDRVVRDANDPSLRTAAIAMRDQLEVH